MATKRKRRQRRRNPTVAGLVGRLEALEKEYNEELRRIRSIVREFPKLQREILAIEAEAFRAAQQAARPLDQALQKSVKQINTIAGSMEAVMEDLWTLSDDKGDDYLNALDLGEVGEEVDAENTSIEVDGFSDVTIYPAREDLPPLVSGARNLRSKLKNYL